MCFENIIQMISGYLSVLYAINLTVDIIYKI